jgi:putative membrane protein
MYEWIKALHVLAIISWMAAILYLPRLFVYHAGVAVGSEASETFKIMERRLLKAIMTPAMIVSWATGLYIAYAGGWLTSGWFHVKLVAVLLMTGAHGLLARHVKLFASDMNTRSHRYFRVVNEVPTLLMVVAVIMVIVKPWS